MAATKSKTEDSQKVFRSILGGVAGLAAGTVTHPIELVKIRFQMQDKHAAHHPYKNFP
jgi:hypothetical protein